MKITILTLFPEMFDPLKYSIIGRATKNGIIDLNVLNIRDYTLDKHGKCDDIPYGGGAGMVMTPQPIASAIKAADPDHNAKRIFLTPVGKKLNSQLAKELATEKELLLLCGHYEGVDQRVIDLYIDEEISIGDYVLTGGEIPALVLIDCVSRYIKGVLGSEQSAEEESFSYGFLEYPQYTRPQVFEGLEVPAVLLSGHHKNIEQWRKEQAQKITMQRRPDLLQNLKSEN